MQDEQKLFSCLQLLRGRRYQTLIDWVCISHVMMQLMSLTTMNMMTMCSRSCWRSLVSWCTYSNSIWRLVIHLTGCFVSEFIRYLHAVYIILLKCCDRQIANQILCSNLIFLVKWFNSLGHILNLKLNFAKSQIFWRQILNKISDL